MTHRKRKKDTRMRGSHSHGWGDKKKRRGFGHRGGKGLAGRYTGANKPSVWAEGRKHSSGFDPKNIVESIPINVGDVNLMIEHNKFEKKGSTYDVNLSDLGYTKLLSKGKIKYNANITVHSATDRAVKKISAAGGNVNSNKKE